MRAYGISVNENGEFHVNEFPDAAAIVEPSDKLESSRTLRHLSLHRHDMEYARIALEKARNTEDKLTRNIFYENAVIKFTKCFKGSNARVSLSDSKIFQSDTEALSDVKYFISLRDKFIVHDDNCYADCIFGLVIAAEGKGRAIDMILTPTYLALSYNIEKDGKLNRLIARSIDWIEAQYNNVHIDVLTHYENMGREALLKYPNLQLNVSFTAENVHKNRGK